MKTVTYGWLIRQYPTPSLAWSSNKYQYYYCPTDVENPFNCPGKFVKIKKVYMVEQNKKRWGTEDE